MHGLQLPWVLAALYLVVGCSSGSGDRQRDAGEDAGIADGSFEDVPPRCDVAEPSDENVVAIETGLIRGVTDGVFRAFVAIPYAAPPVGELRWKRPQLPACWEGELAPTEFSAICFQPSSTAASGYQGSEDCLTLNVFTPADLPSELLPVIVFIHGGGNMTGSAAYEDGTGLVREGPAIVVTIQYRLGPMGFLSHPTLTSEDPDHTSGNYGILDQIAALQWVQRNIRAFGGDPSRVAINGQSAGATDIAVLLASPRARGLFSRAIIQSGTTFSNSLTESEEYGEATEERLGCDDASDPIACMREVGVETFYMMTADTFEDRYLYAKVDGYVLEQSPREAFLAHDWNVVPTIIGFNSDEVGGNSPGLTAEELRNRLAAELGATDADRVLAVYPAEEYGTPAQIGNAIANDLMWSCPSRIAARGMAGTEGASVYMYFFTRQGCHSCEVPYIGYIGSVPSTTEDAMLATAMRRYWTNHAADGDPNGSDVADWPAWDPDDQAYVRLDVPISSGEGLRAAPCDVWESIDAAP